MYSLICGLHTTLLYSGLLSSPVATVYGLWATSRPLTDLPAATNGFPLVYFFLEGLRRLMFVMNCLALSARSSSSSSCWKLKESSGPAAMIDFFLGMFPPRLQGPALCMNIEVICGHFLLTRERALPLFLCSRVHVVVATNVRMRSYAQAIRAQ